MSPTTAFESSGGLYLIFSPAVPVCHKPNAWCLSPGSLHMLALRLLSIPARLVGGQDCTWRGLGCGRNLGFRELP